MNEIYGWVTNIQRFCIHDGDGIRTTVFLQGCPLHCLWCCNPENMSAGTKIKYNTALCTACGRCAAACPNRALTLVGEHMETDRARCTACGACVPACPTGARSLWGARMRVSEVLSQVIRDAVFYHRSGGGLTLSGGECLCQPAFSAALLQGAKAQSLHTAIETCGCADWDVFARILPDTDLFLFDVKHVDPQAHAVLTGRDNRLILDNLRRLGQTGARVILRVPVIAGKNDDPGNLLAIAALAREVGAARIELLPYHKLGVQKYQMLGIPYRGAALTAPESDVLAQRAAEMRKTFPSVEIKQM